MLYSINNKTFYCRFILLLTLIISIGACSSFKPATDFQSPDWLAKGKLAIRAAEVDGGRSYAVSFRWRQHGPSSLIEFFSPLGSRLFLIQKMQRQTVLVDQYGQQLETNSIAELAQLKLGVQLPIDDFAELMFEGSSSAALEKIKAAGWKVQSLAFLQERLKKMVLINASGSRVIFLVKHFEN